MSVRSSDMSRWACCGRMLPEQYSHCPYCGGAVMLVRKVLLRFPTPDGVDVAVVTDGRNLDAEGWATVREYVSIVASGFARKDQTQQAAPEEAHPSPQSSTHGIEDNG